MDAGPVDALLLRQQKKLNAHAEWVRQQRLQRPLATNSEAMDLGTSAGERTPLAVAQGGHQRGAREGSLGESARGERSPAARPHGAGDNCFIIPRGGSVARVQERNALWQRRREEKLEEQRMMRGEDFSECTFTPKINVSAGAARDASAPASGFDAFVSRQERARQMARAKEERARVDGSRWTSARTVAEPFLLGRRHAAEAIASLRRPVPGVAGAAGRALDGAGGAGATAAAREEGTALESLAAVLGRGLPPPGAFSAWSALRHGSGESSADTASL